jgi:putative tricarboxylic transport membrane protein
MFDGILIGLQTAFTPTNLLMVAAGCFAGTFIGMLPGLGPVSAIALMIPITYGLDPASGLILIAGVYYGAVFGGSTSAILINAPGVSGAVATAFDGYPMARSGKPGKALAIAAYSSFAGGTIGAILLLMFVPFLASISLSFQSSEYFALMVFGCTAVAALAGSESCTDDAGRVDASDRGRGSVRGAATDLWQPELIRRYQFSAAVDGDICAGRSVDHCIEGKGQIGH